MSEEKDGADRAGGPEVVVGVDGSPDSCRALVWAAREAKLRNAELVVVHANFIRSTVEPEHPRLFEKERRVLESALEQARRCEPGLKVSGRLAEPPAAKALIEASKAASLLVVGSRGLGGVKEFMLGSVSSSCAHQAHCPVVIVRPETS